MVPHNTAAATLNIDSTQGRDQKFDLGSINFNETPKARSRGAERIESGDFLLPNWNKDNSTSKGGSKGKVRIGKRG